MTRKSFFATLLAGPLAFAAGIGLIKRKPVVLCADEVRRIIQWPGLFYPKRVEAIRTHLRRRDYVLYERATGKFYPPMFYMSRDDKRNVTYIDRQMQRKFHA